MVYESRRPHAVASPREVNAVASAFLLTFAGVGLRTNFRQMRNQGLGPFAVGFIGEIAIALFTLVLVIAAGRLFGF